jgi:hypothetical protein
MLEGCEEITRGADAHLAQPTDQSQIREHNQTATPFESTPYHNPSTFSAMTDTMDAGFNLDDIFKFQEWASQRSTQLLDAVTSSGVGASPLSESAALGATPNGTPRASNEQYSSQQSQLAFLQEAKWDPQQIYDGDPPSFLEIDVCVPTTLVWGLYHGAFTTRPHQAIQSDQN